jgi:hypothetical protein
LAAIVGTSPDRRCGVLRIDIDHLHAVNQDVDVACAFAERICKRVRAEPFDLHETVSVASPFRLGWRAVREGVRARLASECD